MANIVPYTRHPIVQQALQYLADTCLHTGSVLTSPSAVRDYLHLLLADRPHEIFTMVLLDSEHRVLDTIELFRGTLTHTKVHPREVVIEALARNAWGVILAHNHPGGSATPSGADLQLTKTLRTALSLVDIRVLDHLIVTPQTTVSLAESGLL